MNGVALFALSTFAVTGTSSAAGRIVEVTVFPDRAEVVRELRVELARGTTRIEFSDLPEHLERESLRVTARGVEATLGAVEIREHARPPAQTPELLAARQRVRALDSALAALAAEEETDAELRAFLAALKATTSTRASEKLGEGGTDPAALQATYQFVHSGLQDLGKRKLSRAEKRLELEADLALARASLAVLQPAGPIRARVATVEVMTDAPGSLTVRLAYLTPGASWRPSYRASLDAATGVVTLDTEALVRQHTGENWDGVSLRLSTTAPARGVRAPVLEPWLLRPIQNLGQGRLGAFGQNVNADTIEEMDVITSGADAGFARTPAAMPEETAAARQAATLVLSAYNLVFEVPGRAEIPGDDADHLVALRRDPLRGEMEYHVVPMLSESAFLVVRTKAPVTMPLLAGRIHLFTGGAYLGAAGMTETGPGADLTLPFGADNRITVKSVRLPQQHSETGLTGRDRRIAFGSRATVENLLAHAATVVLEERIPVSEDERIEVEPAKTTTSGSTMAQGRPGIMTWRFRLEPGARQEVAVDYAVRLPGDIVIAGLQ